VEGWLVAGAALAVGLMTIYSMTKIWAAAFWSPHPEGREPRLASLAPPDARALVWPIAALAAMTVAIGLAPDAFVAFAETAAAQLLDPAPYISAVLGVTP